MARSIRIEGIAGGSRGVGSSSRPRLTGKQIAKRINTGKMKMKKQEAPLGGVSKAVLKYAARTGARIIADRKGAAILAEKTARRRNPIKTNEKDDLRRDPGGTGGSGNVYRAPGKNNRPRLRDTDNTPRKTTVRQLVGPKTKSGKMIEKKYPAKVNTKPPVKKAVAAKPKAELPPIIKFRGRVIAINRRSANPRIRKREEAQLRISRREYAVERQRQAKLAARRTKKEDATTNTNFGIYSRTGKKYTVSVPRTSSGSGAIEERPAQTTIESRLASRSESVPLQSRNQSSIGTMSRAELRRYAQLLRESNVKTPNVSKAQIARGRARALQPTAERRAAAIKDIQRRAVAKARARGMTQAQINRMIADAKAEAAAIARKAGK